MKIEEIIDKLCSHEISKHEAIEELTTITKGLRKNKALEFEVTYVAYTAENNHGILHLKLPYQYSKMGNRVKVGDSVDVVFLP